MAEKVTEMRLQLKVDLQCHCCHKKVKKILCKFPQIRDQVYDEKNNMVRITVVCCSPEETRDKLCCKGGKVIKSIEIVEPPPPPPPPPPPAKSEDEQKQPVSTPPPPERVTVSVQALPIGVCCAQCYEGYPGGPCYQGHGRLLPPPCYGYPYAYGYNMVCYVGRCDQYFSDENPSACSIM